MLRRVFFGVLLRTEVKTSITGRGFSSRPVKVLLYEYRPGPIMLNFASAVMSSDALRNAGNRSNGVPCFRGTSNFKALLYGSNNRDLGRSGAPAEDLLGIRIRVEPQYAQPD